jgi:3-dehydroquinate dehydratase
MPTILVIQGPGLNLAEDQKTHLSGVDILKATLIDRVNGAKSNEIADIILNPPAFTHTSVASRDATAADSRTLRSKP